MTDATLLAVVRHNGWANDQLIDFCSRLSTEQLAWTIPGTYGSVHATLCHIVGAEHYYLFVLTGHRPPIDEPATGVDPTTPDWLAPLDELAERARSNAERMEAVLSSGFDPARQITRRQGTAAAAIIVSQFIHHGSDHRAHVASILGAHGLEPPSLDVWAYGRSIGAVSPPPA